MTKSLEESNDDIMERFAALKHFKKFQKREKQLDKWLARANRPRDKIGRVIKKNGWGDEIVRVKNKWMLRSKVEGS